MPSALPLTEQTIAARLERLPNSRWHVTVTVILGSRHLLRFVRFAGDRLCIAGDRAGLAYPAIEHRRLDQRRQFRSGARRLDFRLGRGAHRPRRHRAHRHRAVCGDELGLRLYAELRAAFRVAFSRRHRARRRDSGRLDLYQRDSARRAARRPLPRLSDDFSGRPVGVGSRRRDGGAEIRLAMDVHHRRGAGVYRAVPAALLSGIAALAGLEGAPHRSRRHRHRYRAHRIAQWQKAAAARARPCHSAARQSDPLAGAVPRPLFVAHLPGLDPVGGVVHRRLRLGGLDPDALPRGLSPAAAASAQLFDRRPRRQPARLADLRLHDRLDRPPLLVYRRVLSDRGGIDRAMGLSDPAPRSGCCSAMASAKCGSAR